MWTKSPVAFPSYYICQSYIVYLCLYHKTILSTDVNTEFNSAATRVPKFSIFLWITLFFLFFPNSCQHLACLLHFSFFSWTQSKNHIPRSMSQFISLFWNSNMSFLLSPFPNSPTNKNKSHSSSSILWKKNLTGPGFGLLLFPARDSWGILVSWGGPLLTFELSYRMRDTCVSLD